MGIVTPHFMRTATSSASPKASLPITKAVRVSVGLKRVENCRFENTSF